MHKDIVPLSDKDQLLGGLRCGTRFYAASIATARNRLSTPDQYYDHQSDFDRQARAGISPGIVDSDTLKQLYIGYVENQVLEWDEFEILALKQIVGSMNLRYRQIPDFRLPEIVYLVKTTGYEEGAAAYTRQLDTIVLPLNMISSIRKYANDGDPLHPAHVTAYLESIVTHESFHVFSKNADLNTAVTDRSTLKQRLYKSIGYNMTSNDVVLPDVGWPFDQSVGKMNEFRITNPDSPRLASYVEMNTPSHGQQKLMPLLMASGVYNGGAFFNYLEWYMMAVEEQRGVWQAVMRADHNPLLFRMDNDDNPHMKEEYLSLVGYNLSGEIFQADEVLAQNFVKLLTRDLPSPWVLSNIAKAFEGPSHFS